MRISNTASHIDIVFATSIACTIPIHVRRPIAAMRLGPRLKQLVEMGSFIHTSLSNVDDGRP